MHTCMYIKRVRTTPTREKKTGAEHHYACCERSKFELHPIMVDFILDCRE
jgi:hypothetical protein